MHITTNKYRQVKNQQMMDWVYSEFDEQDVPNHKSVHNQNKIISLWVDEFLPSTVKDLAVHRKKVEEVEKWLVNSQSLEKSRKILLLTGPAGCGKSTTLQVLCNRLDVEIMAWSNSNSVQMCNEFSSNIYSSFDNMNQSQKFQEFILRTSRYRSVCSKSNTYRVILVDEFPYTFLMNPSNFFDILRKYWKSSSYPLVFIVSEDSKNSIMRSLFPTEILQQFSMTNISFNPISQTGMKSALSRVLELSTNQDCDEDLVRNVIDSSLGDLRSAVNALQFTLQTKLNSQPKDFKVKKRVKSRKRDIKGKNIEATQQLNESQTIGAKDNKLPLFRALGKVLYCKRTEPFSPSELKSNSLPNHLIHHERPPLLENPENVFEKSECEASTFALFLHQNCPSFYSSIDDYCNAIQYFTHADLFDAFWEPSNALKTYVSSVSIRGVMHSVPLRKNSSFKALVKPRWFSVFKTIRDRENSIRRFSNSPFINSRQLTSELVPFMAKIFAHEDYQTQDFALLQEIGSFVTIKPNQNSSHSLAKSKLNLCDFLNTGLGNSSDKVDVINKDGTENIEFEAVQDGANAGSGERRIVEDDFLIEEFSD